MNDNGVYVYVRDPGPEVVYIFDPNSEGPIEVLELGLSQKREESK